MLGRSHRFLGITSTFWGVNVPCSRTQHGLTRVGLEPPTSGSGVRGINHQATAFLWRDWGANPRPTAPEADALTTRLSGPYTFICAFLIHFDAFWAGKCKKALATLVSTSAHTILTLEFTYKSTVLLGETYIIYVHVSLHLVL